MLASFGRVIGTAGWCQRPPCLFPFIFWTNTSKYDILCIMHHTFVKGARTERMNVLEQAGKDSQATILTKITIAEQIAAALRNEIVTGQLAAGSRLRQVEIAQRFGVSTTPVREAFGLL